MCDWGPKWAGTSAGTTPQFWYHLLACWLFLGWYDAVVGLVDFCFYFLLVLLLPVILMASSIVHACVRGGVLR